MLTLGRGDTSFPLRLPLAENPCDDICACEKNIGRIRTGAAANSPKACAAFCLCCRDIREAVPYEKDRHPSLYKGGAFGLPCEGGRATART